LLYGHQHSQERRWEKRNEWGVKNLWGRMRNWFQGNY
jgi:hypothetical protein